ncbi:MAG: M28 family peptidase [Planctomycetota bacterium]|jgi:hypothetical protein
MYKEKESAEHLCDSNKESIHKENKCRGRFKFKVITRNALIRLVAFAVIAAIIFTLGYRTMIAMPGRSYKGPLPKLTQAQEILRGELYRDIRELADVIGQRNVWNYKNLIATVEFLELSLINAGLEVRRQSFTAEKEICYNLEIEITGVSKPEEIVIIGAHYDTVFGTVGANDNGSGVAAALALVRRFKGRKIGRTLRFALFANEEPPFFQTDAMGSVVYAKSCREKKENIVAMLSLETIGYYTDEPKSQQYPFPFNMFYLSTGNFIGFVSNVSSRQLLKQVIKTFRENCKFPSEGGAVPEFVQGIGWSDHWAFWKYGYPAVMVTDTAPFRYPYYHGPEDTPEKIDYERLAIVVSGIEAVVDSLVIVPGSSDK